MINRMMKHSILLLAAALFIGACSSPATNADPKYAADDALLEKTHAEMRQRLDSATVHFAVFAERVKRAKPDDPAPRELERPSIWLGDLQSILESDVRFMAERKAALSGEGTPEDQQAMTARYDEFMQGHAAMVAEFNAIADKLEERAKGD